MAWNDGRRSSSRTASSEGLPNVLEENSNLVGEVMPNGSSSLGAWGCNGAMWNSSPRGESTLSSGSSLEPKMSVGNCVLMGDDISDIPKFWSNDCRGGS